MAKIAMKFGGTSMADLTRIRHVAGLVKREVERGNQVAVVVSAMAGETNKLDGWTRELSPLHDAREYDVVVASGEQITAGLLAIALGAIGINARSWMGWQVPILTDDSHGKAGSKTSRRKSSKARWRRARSLSWMPSPPISPLP